MDYLLGELQPDPDHDNVVPDSNHQSTSQVVETNSDQNKNIDAENDCELDGYASEYEEDLSDMLNKEDDLAEVNLHQIEEFMILSLTKVTALCGTKAFVDGRLNVNSDGLLGNDKVPIHDYFLMKGVDGAVIGGKPVDEIAGIMLSYGVAPDCGSSFLLNVLCSRKEGDTGFKELVSRRLAHSKLAAFYEVHRKTYENNNSRQNCNQAVSEFLEYSIYAMSCSNLFGVRSDIIEGK